MSLFLMCQSALKLLASQDKWKPRPAWCAINTFPQQLECWSGGPGLREGQALQANQWEPRVKTAGSELENGIKYARSFAKHTDGLTVRSRGGCCSAWCPDGGGITLHGESCSSVSLFPRSPTLHRQISPRRNFCVLCRNASVPPRTPAMNYFTGAAP